MDRSFTASQSPPQPSQLRAARALLGWSLLKTAATAKVSVSKILDSEGRAPERVCQSSMFALLHVFETVGVQFLAEGNSRGVIIRLDQ